MNHRIVRWRGLPAAGALGLLVCTAVIASCGDKGTEGTAGAGPDTVLAKVEGTEIKQSDIDVAKTLIPAQFQSLPDEVLIPALLDQLIDRRIASLAAEKAGLDKDPKVQLELAHSREDVLQSAFLRQSAEAAVTDDAVRARFEERNKTFMPEPEVHARHILTEDESTIRRAASRIAAGEPFETAAGELSIDGSAQEGGDLGFFTRDRMVSEFSDVAFSLDPGQVSEPFQTQFGWHIVKVEEKRDTTAPTLAEVENEIKSELTNEHVRAKIDELRAAAKIERMDAAPEAPQVGPPVSSPEATDAPMPIAPEGEAAPAEEPASDAAPAPPSESDAPGAN